MTAIVVLDVETTGKDRATDQIVELSIRLGLGRHEDIKRDACGRFAPGARS